MTPAHLSAAVDAAVRAAVDDGDLVLPSGAGSHGETGGVVPVDDARTRPGAGLGADFLTAAPLRLAALSGRPPAEVAGVLAERLRRVPGLADAVASPSGHCALRLRPDARGELAAVIAAAGPAYARSRALDGAAVTVAKAGNLARAHTLDQARVWLAAEVAGRLTETAGGRVTWVPPEPADPPDSAPVAALLAAAGVGATHYALLRTPPGTPLDPAAWARADTGNPAYAVRYAHAHAAGLLRQATALDITPAGPRTGRGSGAGASPGAAAGTAPAGTGPRTGQGTAPGSGAGASPGAVAGTAPATGTSPGSGPGTTSGAAARAGGAAAPGAAAPPVDAPPAQDDAALDAPAERALLGQAADLPRRVALAADPANPRPELIVRYLDALAEAYLRWQVVVLPVGEEKPTGAHAARVALVGAVRTVLGTGLGLLGVAAPTRM